MKTRAASIAFMFLLTLVATGLLSGVQEAMKNRIEANRRARLEGVVLKVLGIPLPEKAGPMEISRVFGKRVREEKFDGDTVYTGLGKDGKSPVGLAFPLFGPGFWGPIRGMMGVSPDLSRVLGVSFYQHEETPGLGGRIEEPWFVKQFAGKPLHLGPSGEYFRLVQPGTARGENQVDAITGATETSTRLETFLNRNMKNILPVLKHREGRPIPADKTP